MTVPIVWYSAHADVDARKQWDAGLLRRLFDRRLWAPPCAVEFAEVDTVEAAIEHGDGGAVVVVPAQHHASPDDVAELQNQLDRLAWAVVLLVGDECSLFPWEQLSHPNMRLWVMTPAPPHRHAAARFIGEGFGPPETPDIIAKHEYEAMRKEISWVFAGQVTHQRRRECVRNLKALHREVPGSLVETPGFLAGLDRHDYLAAMAAAKVAPCPSGPCTPDSFRAYEALEAGALPLVDAVSPKGPSSGYWPLVCGETPPFPVVQDWGHAPHLVKRALRDWPANVNRASAWWQRRKREMAWWLEDDIAAVRGARPAPTSVADRVTVLIPTSPIPSHPSTAVIEETIASVRAQPDLHAAEIVVMIDGVRPEQEDRSADYDQYVRRLLWLTNHRWRNVVPLLAGEWLHQANLTRRGLELVRTPLVLFVEHDTPLCGPIPWGELAEAVESGDLNVVRLHHEAAVLDVHQHLMVDHGRRWDHWPTPLLRTMQWSQRPHLASAGWYRSTLDRYFGAEARTMIEDCLHGVVDHAWRTRRFEGWAEWRLALYAPHSDMKRSLHIDGRAGEPKYEMTYAYDGDTPDGAPFPSALRVPEPSA